MNCDQIRNAYLAEIEEQFACEEVSLAHWLVSGHNVALDGDHSEVHVISTDKGGFLLSDMGECLRELANDGIDINDSERRMDILNQIRVSLGVELQDGRFVLEVSPNDLGSGISRYFQALGYIGDLAFTAHPREENIFSSEVAELLKPIASLPGSRFRTNEKFRSKSERDYNADFYVYVVNAVYIDAITAASAASFANKVFKTHTMFSDTDPRMSVRKMTLLDDTCPFMNRADANLLSQVSDVQFWSNRAAFKERVIHLTDRN